jgi:hypothetical protein
MSAEPARHEPPGIRGSARQAQQALVMTDALRDILTELGSPGEGIADAQRSS